jgi:light-regulated signal transduction histidine kinase (bacteriophytochrome)
MALIEMKHFIGTWDFDLTTGLVKIGPTGAVVGALRFPDGQVPLAELEGHLHGEDREALSSALHAWIAGPASAFTHSFRIGSDGTWTWIDVTARRGDDGRTLAGVWVDATARKASEARKDEAVARVHQFAAAASHDLIGPLRHIAMYGDMLISDFGADATEEKRQMLQTITDKARMLQVLTKRLIAFSTDIAAPEFLTVPLDRALANVEKRMADELREADAVIMADGLPEVVGDPVLLEKVLEHLIRNALQWRGTRRPAIRMKGKTEGKTASVAIADNGAGIDPRYAPRIFDAFWSLPHPARAKGAGLGLAVCKTITNALGGEITLVSSSPEGSTFELVLPAAR